MSARESLEVGLEAAYGQLTEVARGLTDATALLPTRCAGWAVSDSWDDTTCALKGTGRLELTAGERSELGSLAAKLPLFG